jgi:hypothetical protein
MRAYIIIIIFTISYCNRKSSDKKVCLRCRWGKGFCSGAMGIRVPFCQGRILGKGWFV